MASDNLVDELSYLGETKYSFLFQGNFKTPCLAILRSIPRQFLPSDYYFFYFCNATPGDRTWDSHMPGDLAPSYTVTLPNCLANDWSVAGL